VEPTRKIANILIWIFALVMAYPYLPGAHTEAFKGMSVLIGLMVSLGASSIVGQGASGLILMYSRTLRSGEYVRIGEHEGTIVVDQPVHHPPAHRPRRRDHPAQRADRRQRHAQLLAHRQRRGFMVDTSVTIGYDTPWRQVEAMLIEAAGRTPASSPRPARGFSRRPCPISTLNTAWWPRPLPAGANPRADIVSRLHANIQDVFNEYGVQIMSPHYIDDPANVPPGKVVHAPRRQATSASIAWYHPASPISPKHRSPAVSSTPERRKNLSLRELVDKAYVIIEPFFDPASIIRAAPNPAASIRKP
jgi:hypothetical protein